MAEIDWVAELSNPPAQQRATLPAQKRQPLENVDWADVMTNPNSRELERVEKMGMRPATVEPTPDPASFGRLVLSNLVDDPATKARVFAEGRGIDPSRYDVLQEVGPQTPTGREQRGQLIVYRGDDGKLYSETSGKVKQFMAGQVANLPTTVLSAAGAATGSPLLAAAGGMAGETIRKGAGALLYDEPQTPMGNLMDVATAGATGATAALGGKVPVSSINASLRARSGRLAATAGRDVQRMNAPAIKAAEQQGLKQGVTLFPPQTTESRRLIDKWKLLADLPDTADVLEDATKKQIEQARGAIANYLETISPATGKYTAGGRLVEASKKAVEEPVLVRQAKAKPFYERAFTKKEVVDTDALKAMQRQVEQSIDKIKSVKPEPDIDAMVAELGKNKIPAMRQTNESMGAFKARVAKDYQRVTKKEPPVKEVVDTDQLTTLTKQKQELESALAGKTPQGFIVPKKPMTVDVSDALNEVNRLMAETVPKDPSHAALKRVKDMIQSAGGDLQKLDRVKRTGIDNVLQKTGTSRTMAREMKLVKDKMVGAMDKASPDYKAARRIFSEYSEEVDRQASKTLVAGVSRLENDQVADAGRKLFASIDHSPELVAKAKASISKYDKDSWDMAVRNYLQDILDKQQASQAGYLQNVGGYFHKHTIGDPKTAKILEAAMNPQQFENLKNLADTMRRVGLIFGKESRTAPAMASMAELRREGQSGLVSAAGTASSPGRLLNIGGTAADKINDVLSGRYNRELAKAMVDPGAAKQLAKIKQLDPNSSRYVEAVAAFIAGIIGAGARATDLPTGEGTLEVPPTGRLIPQR